MAKNVLKEISNKCEDEAEWARGELEEMARGHGYDTEDKAWMAGWKEAHKGILYILKRGVYEEKGSI
jgi:hypothetical protein